MVPCLSKASTPPSPAREAKPKGAARTARLSRAALARPLPPRQAIDQEEVA